MVNLASPNNELGFAISGLYIDTRCSKDERTEFEQLLTDYLSKEDASQWLLVLDHVDDLSILSTVLMGEQKAKSLAECFLRASMAVSSSTYTHWQLAILYALSVILPSILRAFLDQTKSSL